MSEELQTSMQLLEFTGKVVGQGAVLLTNCTMATYQKIMAIRHARILDKAGEISFDKMMQHKGEDITVIDIRTQDAAEIERIKKEFTERKILFVPLPDNDLSDGRTQFMIHVSDADKVNAFYRKNPTLKGESISLDDYSNIGTEETWKNIFDKAKEEIKKSNNKSPKADDITVDEKKNEQLENIKHDNNYKEALQKSGYDEITLNQKLLLSKTDEGFLFRIPKSENEYIYLPKDMVNLLDNKKTYHALIKEKGSYSIYRASGGKVDNIGKRNGRDVLQNFSKVKRQYNNENVQKVLKSQIKKKVAKAK